MVVKIITCVVRKPGMTHDEFDLYWRSQHGAVIQSVPEFTRHVRRYVQCHRAAQDTPLLATSGDVGGEEP